MIRLTAIVLFASTVLSPLFAQQRASRAKFKKIDVEKRIVTLTIDGKDQDFTVTDDTRIANVPGQNLKEQLQSKVLREGADVLYRATTKDGKAILTGLLLERGAERQPPPKFDSSKLKPLTELGKEKTTTSPADSTPTAGTNAPSPTRRQASRWRKR